MHPFVHLHVHSQYSILDGQASIQALTDKAIADGMPALALTDHGNMFGIKEFFNYVSKRNSKLETPLKPILGCEAYVARRGLRSKNSKEDQSGHHLILLAKNKIGYHNLIRIISTGWVEGFYYRPRIDKELLEKYHEGLIATSACLGGELSRLAAAGDMSELRRVAIWYQSLFKEDFYIEIQRHKTNNPNADMSVYPKQKEVNDILIPLAHELGIKIIATNDVHFVDEDHAEAHDHLICLNTGRDLDDPTRMRYSKQEWLKTQREMNNAFSDIPEALSNTLEIAEKVEFYSINSEAIMPDFPIPEGHKNADEYLAFLTYKGAKDRYSELTDEIRERIDFELETIKKMGFPDYFLIVQDFIAAARNMKVAVGPGRGSAAGSVVAYCLKITNIDPLKYDLLFERFLNPDRINMPDIDIDFDDDGRGEVLRWVTQKYGVEKVSHVITFGTMAAKSAIKDVARVERLPLSESDRLTKLIPDRIPNVKKINLRESIKFVPELSMAAESSNPLLRNTMKYAQLLEGNVRNTGVHACAIIIARDNLMEFIPISTADDKETGQKMLVSQYEGSMIEEVGMLKMDFLGLKTLSIIKEAIENIRQTTGREIDIEKIPMDDEATYQLYSTGKTTGTFQFESSGMQKYLKELKPTQFEDLIAMNALYRPGPMDYIPQFIARKHGREVISYDIPIMERFLKDTYGITVYQEQVMLLSRLLANFTRGQSDELRKAMGKKLADKMAALKEKFLHGAEENGHNRTTCEKIWCDWEKFASYAFNKSHATCYSWIAYQTAYLKANYTSEYMAAVLSRNISNITEITKFMDECKALGIEVKGPDVNESNLKFAVNKVGDIRFGLGAVKGVGEGAVQAIREEREKKGPFTGIFDFVERVNLTACNRKNIESLALAGAFDAFGEIHREQFFATTSRGDSFIEQLVRYGNKYQEDKSLVTNSLFGGSNEIEITRPEIPYAETWSDLERLDKERELVGIYLSAHPLDEFAVSLNYGCNTQMVEVADRNELEALEGREIVMGGIVTGFKNLVSKNGKPFGILRLEDYSGTAELMLFGNDYINYCKYGMNGLYLLIRASIVREKYRGDAPALRISSIEQLQDVKDSLIEQIKITLPLSGVNRGVIEPLVEILRQSPKASSRLFIDVIDPERGLKTHWESRRKIEVTKELINLLNENEEILFQINQ